uniref:PDZ domain-containing protein n=1 Tax=Sparus aurata TaxID=8175 RepID=A0A671XFH6_SPAAU
TAAESSSAEVPSPESGVIVKTAEDGCAEGLVYGGGGKEGIFIKQVVPESPASKSLKLKEGDQILSATVYFDNMSYEDAMQIMEHAQAYKMKLCLKRKPDITETEPAFESDVIPFKVSKFGIKTPKIKGPEFDLSVSKKDVKVPDATVEGKLPQTSEIDVNVGGSVVPIQQQKTMVKKAEVEIKPVPTDEELHGQGSRFKMPKLGITMPKVRGTDFEGPSIDTETIASDHEGKGSMFKKPHFGFSMPKVKGPQINLSLSQKDVDVTAPDANVEVKLPEAPKVDVSLGRAEVILPEEDLEVKRPEIKMKHLQAKAGVKVTEVETEEPSADVEIKAPEIKVTAKGTEGSPSKFKMPSFKLPKFGVGTPNVSVKVPEVDKDVKIDGVKGPKVDLSLSKKDVDVTLPEAKTDVTVPEVDLGKVEVSIPEAKIDVPNANLEFNLPDEHKIPEMDPSEWEAEMDDVKSPGTKAGIKLPEVDLGKVDVSTPEAKMEVKTPELEMQSLQIKGELDGKEERFKMPKFGIKMPKGKVPEFDTDGIKLQAKVPDAPTLDVSLGKAEVLVPEVKAEVEKPELEIKPLQTEVEGQGSRFKVPTFGMAVPKVKGPEFHLAKADVKLKESSATAEKAKVEVQKPEVEIKPLQTDYELGGQGGKFKMPTFGITMPKVKGPEIDFSLSKKDKDVRLPEAKAEVKLPEAPKIAMEMKAPDLSKKDENVTLPEAKVDVNLPDAELKEPSAKVEIKAAEIDASLSSMKGSPSKFKMPTFKFPKFGVGTPNISAEVPDKDVKIDGADVSISVPHTDVDVPKVKAEVHLPEVEVKEPSGGVVIDQQPGVELDAKMKKPRFSLPRFSFSKPSVKAPEVDVSLPDVNIAIPEGKVEIKGGEVDMKPPECEAEVDGQGSKFKMSKFGVTMPKVTGPEIDSSLSKKDVDVTLPEAKAEVNLPDIDLKEPSAEVKIKAPEIKLEKKDTKGSALKFKMPTFDLPKFGVGSPSATIEVPDTDKDVKTDGADIKIPEEVLTVDIAAPTIETEGPSIHMKITGPEHEGKGGKFKMPSLGFSGPTVKRPDIDFSLSEKDVDVTLPEAKAKVKLPEVELKEPSADVEVKAPEIKVTAKNTEGSPSKFKMPSFKLPKFGASIPSATIEVPDTDKDVKIDGADISISGPHTDVDVPDVKAGVHLPEVEVKEPTGGVVIDQQPGVELDAKMKKPRFSLPRFSFSKPSVKAPELDVSLPDVNVAIPEGKVEVKGGEAEVQLPEVKLKEPSAEVEVKAPEIKVKTKNTEGSPSKFKMPSFKLPKFGAGTPSATIEVP